MGSWVIGHNIAGYLPEGDTYAFADWEDAAECLRGEAENYADTEDENDAPDEDESGMRAVIDAIYADGDGPEAGKDWQFWAEDNSGRRIVFFLVWSDQEPDEVSE